MKPPLSLHHMLLSGQHWEKSGIVEDDEAAGSEDQ